VTAAAAQGLVAPAVVSAGALKATVASKGPTMPTMGPTGVLTSTVMKGEPTEGWGCPRRCLRWRQLLRRHPQRAHERRRQPEGWRWLQPRQLERRLM
jgi:hypothetical protein